MNFFRILQQSRHLDWPTIEYSNYSPDPKVQMVVLAFFFISRLLSGSHLGSPSSQVKDAARTEQFPLHHHWRLSSVGPVLSLALFLYIVLWILSQQLLLTYFLVHFLLVLDASGKRRKRFKHVAIGD